MNNCSVFINSCDRYSFIWEGWNYFYQKFWNKEIPWKVYFGTEKKGVDFLDVTNLKLGKIQWGEYIHKVMDMIPTDNVFFTMEDHFPVKKLDIGLVKNMYKFFIDNKMDRLGLMGYHHPLKEPTNRIETNFNKTFYQQTRQSQYLSCCQPSLWRKEFLCSVIQKDWGPWHGELTGTQVIQGFENIKIGYLIEDDWYIEALTEGHPRDERHGLNNWKILTENYGWRGI